MGPPVLDDYPFQLRPPVADRTETAITDGARAVVRGACLLQVYCGKCRMMRHYTQSDAADNVRTGKGSRLIRVPSLRVRGAAKMDVAGLKLVIAAPRGSVC